MTRCSSVLGSIVPRHRLSQCSGDVLGWFRLAGIRDPRPLCGGCLAVAANMGYDPQPVPQWAVRALESRLPGKVLGGTAA